jgi:hypothetical protein
MVPREGALDSVSKAAFLRSSLSIPGFLIVEAGGCACPKRGIVGLGAELGFDKGVGGAADEEPNSERVGRGEVLGTAIGAAFAASPPKPNRDMEVLGLAFEAVVFASFWRSCLPAS